MAIAILKLIFTPLPLAMPAFTSISQEMSLHLLSPQDDARGTFYKWPHTPGVGCQPVRAVAAWTPDRYPMKNS